MYFNDSYFDISLQATNFPVSYWPSTESISITWLIIVIATLATNLSMLLMVLCRPNLRILSNAILCSMFICGCVFALLYVFPGRVMIGWPQSSNFLCKILHSAGITFASCYSLHICAICTIKTISITSPFRYRTLLHRKNVILIISLLWIIPFISTFIPILLYKPHSLTCIQNVIGTNYSITERIFYIIVVGVMVIIPTIFTIILYIVAFIKVNHRKKFAMSITNHNPHQNRQIARIGQNKKITIQMLTMLGLFIICWLPYFIFFVLHSSLGSSLLWHWLFYFRYIAFSYLAVNPVLSAYYTKTIRNEIKRLSIRYLRLRKYSSSIYPEKARKPRIHQIRVAHRGNINKQNI